MINEEGARLEVFKKSWTTEYRNQCRLLAEKYGLDGLRQLSKEKILELFPPKQKKDKFDKKKFIICSIISMKQESNEDESLIRGKLWYSILKAITHKVYGKKASQDKAVALKMMSLGYQYFSALAQIGEVTYSDLNIINDGKLQQEFFDGYRNIVLFVEDDDTFHKIKNVCKVIGVKLISGGGQINTNNIEHLSNICNTEDEYTILTLTDGDRYGETITESFLTRCKVLKIKIKEHHHIGINKDQVTKEEFEKHKFRIPIREKTTKKDKKGKVISEYDGKDRIKDLDWVKRNGEFGIELQALGQQKGAVHLKEIVADELLKYCDETLRYDDIQEESFAEGLDKGIESFIESVIKKLRKTITSRAKEIHSDIEDDRELFVQGALKTESMKGEFLWMSCLPIARKITDQLEEDVKEGVIDIKKLMEVE